MQACFGIIAIPDIVLQQAEGRNSLISLAMHGLDPASSFWLEISVEPVVSPPVIGPSEPSNRIENNKINKNKQINKYLNE